MKFVIYQVLTRLFGNDTGVNAPHGPLSVNGCGTMDDFDERALQEIRALGATHIWYTGIIAHATKTNYAPFGFSKDHPAVVKGQAGSAYAIKDYYDIDPDLSKSVPARMREFEALVARTHQAGLKVIIDFVPNHVARQYHSQHCPNPANDLGANDNPRQAFSPQNNFYYFPGQGFHTDFDLCQGAQDPYTEWPAKATGNDGFSAFASHNDWYETIKLNYGIDYLAGRVEHFNPIPSTWKKMLDILLFWADKGIDGFRCDMAEMVPVKFWEWAIPRVRQQHKNLIFIAEVYNPAAYRDYLNIGHFDYLYDKVGLYDTLRAVTCNYGNASQITACWQSVNDIQDHMLSFLENHDEQRLASAFYADDARKGRAPMLVAATLSKGPVMLYFGQELGERGMDEEGFSGRDGRTTIFDYWAVDTISRWRNKGTFNPEHLTTQERDLQDYYKRLLNLCLKEKAITEGTQYDLMYVNPSSPHFNAHCHYAFLRHYEKETLLIIANFGCEADIQVQIPAHAFSFLGMKPQKNTKAHELLSDTHINLPFQPDVPLSLHLPSYAGLILKFTEK